jgi:PBP1b-binding outer membrane lipoprotein LpoB
MKKIILTLILLITLNGCDNCNKVCQAKKYSAQEDCADDIRYYKNLSKSIQDKMFDSCMKSKGF